MAAPFSRVWPYYSEECGHTIQGSVANVFDGDVAGPREFAAKRDRDHPTTLDFG